jgi:hypothetical protein
MHQPGGQEGGIAEHHIERELVIDVTNVFEIARSVLEEDLLEVEADEGWAAEPFSFGQVRQGRGIEVLVGPAIRKLWDAERFEAACVLTPGVPAHVVTEIAQPHGDAGQRVDVAVRGHRGEQDLHGGDSPQNLSH